MARAGGSRGFVPTPLCSPLRKSFVKYIKNLLRNNNKLQFKKAALFFTMTVHDATRRMSEADRAGLAARSPEGHAAKSMHIRGREEEWIQIQENYAHILKRIKKLIFYSLG